MVLEPVLRPVLSPVARAIQAGVEGGLSPNTSLDFTSGTYIVGGQSQSFNAITFSRGTNATLTDSNGRIAWAPHNLLTNSEDFEAAAWAKSYATVTANATVAPDGTTTADKLVEDATTNVHYVGVNAGTVGIQETFSFYAKAAERTWCAAQIGNNGVAYYDLQNGVTGTVTNSTASIVSVGNGWFRCSISATRSGNFNNLIYPAAANNTVNYTGNGTSGIFIWGGQLNIANAPVNLLTWSQDFDNAAWQKTQLGVALVPVVTANAGVAPDGTSTADRISFDCVNTSNVANRSYINQTVSYVSGAVYSASLYVKAFDASNVGKTIRFHIDALGTGVIHTLTADWARVSFTGTSTLTGNSNFLVETRGTFTTQTADVLIWGAQLNTGSVALPYVATTSSIYLPPAYNSTTPKNLLGFTQEPENAAWTKSNSYVQQNLLTWSDGTTAQLGVSSNVTDASTPISPSFANSISFVDNSLLRYAYKTATTVASTAYTLSVYVRMNDDSVPVVGTSVSGDFSITFEGVVQNPISSTVTSVGGSVYRITTPLTATGVVNGNFGVVKYTTQSAKGFRVTGYQLVQGSTAGDYTQTTSAAAPTRYLNWDGTLTGRKLVENTAAAVAHRVQQTVTIPSAPISGTAYLKAGEREWAYLRFDDASSTKFAYFNLTTGVVGTVDSGLTATVVNAGGGWYRCSAVFASPAATASGVFVVGTTTANNTQAYTGDGTSGIYVSDFQLSNSASVDPYVYNPQAAAASAAYYGPRFDYNPTGTPVLGPELVTNGDFSSTANWTTGAGWSISGGVAIGASASTNLLQSNVAPSPVGKTYQVTLTVVSRTAGSIVPQIGGSNFTISAAGTYTFFLTPSLGDATFYIPGSGFSGTIDNVSVREVTGYTATANGLLIEEQRTNLLLYSEQFDNAYWAKLGGAITANAASSPDGTVNADSFIEDTSTGLHIVYRSVSITSGTVYTLSYWAKRGVGSRDLSIRLDNGTSTLRSFVNLATGAVSANALHTVTAKLFGSYWYVTCTVTATATTSVVVGAEMAAAGNVATYTGDGTSSIDIWGAQLEAGSFATSYIPTVASQVTRNADSASMLGDNFYTWYNPNQGTLYVEGGGSNAAGSARLAGISDGTFSNRIINYLSGATQLAGLISSGGAAQANPTVNVTSAASANKLAQGYLVNNVNIAANGTLGTLDTVATIPAVTLMRIGADEAGTGAILNGTIRRIGYYNTRLPDSTLTALTT